MRSIRNNLPLLFSCLCLSCTALNLFLVIPKAHSQSKSDWQQRWGKTLRAAKKDGRVVVWGPPGELIREAMTKNFQQAYPDIAVEYSGARGGAPKPGDRYWLSYTEEHVKRSAEEAKILKELFGR
jgi:hypothetical protein